LSDHNGTLGAYGIRLAAAAMAGVLVKTPVNDKSAGNGPVKTGGML